MTKVLGRNVAAPARVDPTILERIDRERQRRSLGLVHRLPFRGEDVWRCYELSWLRPSGVPDVGVLTLRVPCQSTYTVESKSLKLYLGGFAYQTFEHVQAIANRIAADLETVCEEAVAVELNVGRSSEPEADFTGFSLDDLTGLNWRTGDAEPPAIEPDRTLLVRRPESGADAVHTHLFRSLCPVTRQPDLAAVAIRWRGRLLDRESVLRYLVSYRHATSFHEHVIERIFMDVRGAADADEIAVDGRFLRRGGIDINPYRSTRRASAPTVRIWRQ